MSSLLEQLTKYAAYHRDRRNIATHLVGVPMIVLATATLLSRPAFPMGGLPVSPALVVSLLAVGFYLALDAAYAAVLAALLGVSVWAGARLAAGPTSTWLAVGLGLFALGWVIQLVGHAYEGKKPAFVDDLVGLLVGPLFVVAEVGFALGLRDDLRRGIEEKVGPTLIRNGSMASARP